MVIKNLSVVFLISVLLLHNTAFATGASTPLISDWAQDEITEAEELGLVTDNLGDDYTVPITRLQFSGLAVSFAETTSSAAITPLELERFDDTSDTAVLKAAAAGITNGTGPNSFSPDTLITREEIATMVYRAVSYVSAEKLSDPANLSPYTDATDVSSWAQAAVGSMVAGGVMQGTSNTVLSPKDDTSIEQAVALILRAYHMVSDLPETQEDDTIPAYQNMEQYEAIFDTAEYEVIEDTVMSDLNDFFPITPIINDNSDIVDAYKIYYPLQFSLVEAYEENGTLKNGISTEYHWYIQLKNATSALLYYDEETEAWEILEVTDTTYRDTAAQVETTTTEMVTNILAENFDADTEIEVVYLRYYVGTYYEFAYIIAGEDEYLIPYYVPTSKKVEVGKLYTLAEVVALLKGE
ncbi:MAG: S-layer homology domain-containing protein [Oscillospiraceae bacterium]|nr:S-layer homology domain-containing protein [Oscillospiraceae bacterium]